MTSERTFALALSAFVAVACVPRAPTPAQLQTLARDVAAKDVADRECAQRATVMQADDMTKCLAYVACRRKVAAEHGATFTGWCAP